MYFGTPIGSACAQSSARSVPIVPPVASIPESGPCTWHVAIRDDIGLVEDCPYLAQTSATLAASFQFDTPALTNDGLADYSGQFKRDFQ